MLEPPTGPGIWAISGPDGRGRSRATLVTLGDGRPRPAAPVEIPVRARFAARRDELVYVVGDDGLAVVSPEGVEVDTAALPPGPWCHIAVVQDHLVAVDYAGALVRVLRLGSDGTVDAVTDEIVLSGHGRHETRQSSAHPHHVLPVSADGTVVIADLGSDRLWIRRFDAAAEKLEDAGYISAPPGSGPRHTRATGPRSLVVACELANTAVLFEQGPAASSPSENWSVTAEIPVGGSGTASLASEVVVSAHARFAYIASRGDDCIGVVDLERKVLVGRTGSAGSWPQHIALAGDTLVVANQRSDSLAYFAVDAGDGSLHWRASTAVPQPVCLV